MNEFVDRRLLSLAWLPSLATLAAGAWLVGGCAGPLPNTVEREAGSPPNVLLIVVDTLRRDRLGLYGHRRNTSPTIDTLGQEGWTFDHHISQASQTVPSTLSLMLSKYPAEHGFVHRYHGQYGNNPPRYPEEFLFLAEVFQEAGFVTGGFVGNPFLGPENGFGQGFDEHVFSRSRGETLTKAARRWLGRGVAPVPKPFFLYLHYMDVHHPYDPPRQFRQLFTLPEGGELVHKTGLVEGLSEEDLEYSSTLYDAGIAYVDAEIARVLESLEELGLREETIVVVTSDHGEEFMEHGGMGHGTSVHGELIRLPLVLSYPKSLPGERRISHFTRQMDLAPTLLSMAGLAVPEEFRGRSLFEPASGVFSEARTFRSIYAEDAKLIWDGETGDTRLYASSDLFDTEILDDPELESQLRAELEEYLKLEAEAGERESSELPKLSKERIEHLRSLGYIQ